MRIGIMSDSHGDFQAIEKAAAAAKNLDLWLHAGDYCSDADHLKLVSGINVISVAGNCDGLAAKSPADEFVGIDGKQIWLTHGHQSGVKFGTANLIAAARGYGADVVVYGHTHIAEVVRLEDLLVVNPGSVARPQQANASFAVLTIEAGKIKADLVELS